MSTKRQTMKQRKEIWSLGTQRHRQHAVGPKKLWKVKDGRSKMATTPLLSASQAFLPQASIRAKL